MTSSGLSPESPSTPVTVPPALLSAVRAWEAADRPKQPAIPWSRSAWITTMPSGYRNVVERLPNPIDRAGVAAEAGNAEDPEGAAELFVAAMVWGFGTVGYGPWRTARVLKNNPDAANTLAHVARLVRTEGGPAAFDWLAGHRLTGLGVAFASKYLYFCDVGGHAQPALVLDRLVRDWVIANDGWRVRLDWNRPDYRRYVDTMSHWAAELGVTPGEVEQVVFQDQVRRHPRSQWLASPTASDAMGYAREAATDRDGTEDADVLDALEQLSESFAALPELTPADQDDVETHLRSLRRIALIHLHGLQASTPRGDG